MTAARNATAAFHVCAWAPKWRFLLHGIRHEVKGQTYYCHFPLTGTRSRDAFEAKNEAKSPKTSSVDGFYLLAKGKARKPVGIRKKSKRRGKKVSGRGRASDAVEGAVRLSSFATLLPLKELTDVVGGHDLGRGKGHVNVCVISERWRQSTTLF